MTHLFALADSACTGGHEPVLFVARKNFDLGINDLFWFKNYVAYVAKNEADAGDEALRQSADGEVPLGQIGSATL